MDFNFREEGNGFPQSGDVLVDHSNLKAYLVGSGGNIRTGNAMRGQANECTLSVEIIDYEDYQDFLEPGSEEWEI